MMVSQRPVSPFSFHALAVLLLVLFAFGMSALVSDRVFERLPHLEDEVAYVFQARTYARGQWVVESPPQEIGRALWQPFVINKEGVRYGKYSPGWPMVLTFGEWLGQLWIVNALGAAFTVALVYRLGKDIFDKDVGLIAAALTSFSPMALLLNGSLMGHTSALMFVMLFMVAYWQLEHRRRHRLAWGILAGVALGMVASNRPLTAVALALPFVAWSVIRLLGALPNVREIFIPMLRKLVILGLIAILFALTIPIYSSAATGNPRENLYTLVWSYDTVGFGECCGRAADRGEGGHKLEAGIRHMKFDLSLMAADLFGWQVDRQNGFAEITPDLQEHLRVNGDYWPYLGLSWLLLPFGLIVAYRTKSLGIAAWLALGYAWLQFAIQYQGGALARQTEFSYLWVGLTALWLVVPLFWFKLRKAQSSEVWAWILVVLAIGLILVQLMYWIGSQRYSTRYYYETLGALAIISALPLAWLGRRIGRQWVYSGFALLLAFSLYTYSTPRIDALYHFNFIERDMIDQINARRTDDRPVLVLITGDNVRWRAYGELMASTSPYLDSDIVAAWVFPGNGVREGLLEMFPDRQVIDMEAEENASWFTGER